MSAKYSNSPALHLSVGSSRVRLGLYLALCLCTLFALYLLYVRGYPLLASGLAPMLCMLLLRGVRAPPPGFQVRWRQGLWELGPEGALRPVCISAASTCLPWVIYLAWKEQPEGRRSGLWLFADSVPAAQLRQLRVRLALRR